MHHSAEKSTSTVRPSSTATCLSRSSENGCHAALGGRHRRCDTASRTTAPTNSRTTAPAERPGLQPVAQLGGRAACGRSASRRRRCPAAARRWHDGRRLDERQNEHHGRQQHEAADLLERFHPRAGLGQKSQQLGIDADEHVRAGHAEPERGEDDECRGDAVASRPKRWRLP